jgi:pimeloyl-ACP methyl ester carboxylesterase
MGQNTEYGKKAYPDLLFLFVKDLNNLLRELIGMKYERYLIDENERKRIGGEYAILSDGHTHYELKGEGAPVVLVHGFSTPLYIYDKIFISLTKMGYKVLRYDLYGRGFSDRPNKKNSLDLLVKQLEELIDLFFPGEKIFLMGTSMGGSVVAAYAKRHPSRIEKLFLFAPAGMPFRPPLYMKLSKIPVLGDLVFKTMATPIMVKGITNELIYSINEKEYYQKEFLKSVMYKGFSRALLSSLRNIVLKPKMTLPGFESLDINNVKVVAIWGTADKTMPYYQAETLKKVVKSLTFYEFEGSGHLFIFDEGERTMAIIEKELSD